MLTFRPRHALLIPVLLLNLFSVLPAFSSDTADAAHEWWISSGKDVLVLVDPGPQYRARVEVGPTLMAVVRSPEGRLVAVASAGDTSTNATWSLQLELWPKAGGAKSQVTLVSGSDYTPVARLEVAFLPRDLAFSSDGQRLLVVSLGQMSKNKQKQILPQITLLDVPNAKVLSQAPLTSSPIAIWRPAGSDLVLVPCAGFKPGTPVPPELAVVNLTTGAIEKIALPSAPVAWHDMGSSDRRYLELENHVLVVGADGKLGGEPLTAGSELLLFGPAGEGKGRYFMAGKTGKQGQLALVEEGRVTKTAAIPPATAVLLDVKNSRLFVCASKKGVVLNAESLGDAAELPLPGAFHEVMLDPAQKRLFVNAMGDHVMVVDVETRQQVGQFTSGRGSVKFLQELGAAAAQGLSRMQYQLTGVPGMGMMATAPTAVQSMAFSPSGNFIYVFNSATSDITVVDTKTFISSTRKVPTGMMIGQALWRTPGGGRLISVGYDKLLVFDTEKGELLTEQQFPKARLQYEPSFGRIVVKSREATEIYDAAPLNKLKSLPPLGNLTFYPEGKRLFAIGDKGLSIFDYDLNLVQEVAGVKVIGKVERIPMPTVPAAAKPLP